MEQRNRVALRGILLSWEAPLHFVVFWDYRQQMGYFHKHLFIQSLFYTVKMKSLLLSMRMGSGLLR
jgi:hypothetical protein